MAQAFTTSQGPVPEMLLVVDQSGSMADAAPGAQVSKWTQVRQVLTSVTQSLQSEVDFGLALFPNGGENSCTAGILEVDVRPNRATQIANRLAVVNPAGGTPVAATLLGLLPYLRSLDPARPRSVLLATDGAPNCVATYNPATCACVVDVCSTPYNCLDDSGAISAVAALGQAGISTFVVGIPGAEMFGQVLNAMADAGGTATPSPTGERYYPTRSAQDLEAALAAIGNRVTQCRFELGEVADPSTVQVSVDGVSVGRDPQHQGGWDVVGGRTLEFYGAACDALAGANHQVSVRFCTP
jgi:hypothetical protein